MSRVLSVLGMPSGAGACGVGQDQGPAGIRAAGLIDALEATGADVRDMGDSKDIPWRPDRTRPNAQNLEAVVDMVQTTAPRVADALQLPDATVLVLGGDCTVGIGTIAGVQQVLGEVGVVYFDLHSDLNTPATAPDGALDWMGLGHMLAVDGSEPALAVATGRQPLLDSEQVLLFAHSMRHSTRFERALIEDLGLDRIGVEEVREEPRRPLARPCNG